MTDDYDRYESECQRIRAENAVLLEEFAAWLIEARDQGRDARVAGDHGEV